MRKQPQDRVAEILATAINMCKETGIGFSREQLAERCGVAPSLISHHFGTMQEFQNRLIEVGCERRCKVLIIVGLERSHPTALALPAAAKIAAVME